MERTIGELIQSEVCQEDSFLHPTSHSTADAPVGLSIDNASESDQIAVFPSLQATDTDQDDDEEVISDVSVRHVGLNYFTTDTSEVEDLLDSSGA